MPSVKCFPYRPHDYMYDPIFTVSGPTDHYKAAGIAKMSTTKFQICPIFPNMFSDLPHYPRVQYVRRKQAPLLSYREKLEGLRKLDDPFLHRIPQVIGADRCKFFCSVINFPTKECLPHQEHQAFRFEKTERKTAKIVAKHLDLPVNVYVETKFRESSSQTTPWQPPFKIIGEGEPEILKLNFLKWSCGLPVAMHEIRLIERARMRAAWEKSIEPDITDEHSMIRFRGYQEALEMDEWAFREREIDEVQELRLHLLENMLNEIHEKSKTRIEMKMQSFIEKKEAEKQALLEKIRKKSERELRKLDAKQRHLNGKYKEINIMDEHIDKKSEIYAPLLRHGVHPKRWHQVIDDKLKSYKAQFIGVESFSTLPTWLDKATRVKDHDLYNIKKNDTICEKQTHWTGPVLKQLHEDMMKLRKEIVKQPITLRTKVQHEEKTCFTPEVEAIPQEEEEKHQAAVRLQKFVRGRATQMMIYEGRNTCKELIEELRNSVGLMKKQEEFRKRHRFMVKVKQREESMQINMVQKLQGTLGKLQGSVVGTLLDFLNKELKRLLEERKIHAMCLLNERERYLREAAEAGRRQKELRRRREHDEMFKQIVKITQESVDIYLHDVVMEGMDFASKEEASEYITKLAAKVEKETNEIYDTLSKQPMDEQDEVIANMVLHFLVPETEKRIVRENVKLRQQEHLRKIHDVIHSKFGEITNKVSLGSKGEGSIKSFPQNLNLTDDEDTSELLETKSSYAEHHHIDPIEMYLRSLEKEQESIEDPFRNVNQTPEFEFILNERQFVIESLDTIPELSE